MLRGISIWATSALLLLAAVSVPVEAEGEAGRFLVGYDAAEEEAALLAIQAAGGKIHRTSPELHFAVVTTDHPTTFVSVMRVSPSIQYVEIDDRTRLDGAQWNGAQWNGAQWNGAQWNGAQWNGAQWNGAQWNDAVLKDASEAQRQAAKWTEKHYQANPENKMQWAGDRTDPGLVWQWGTWATNATKAWTAGKTGARSASLCVLDSGVAWDHADLAPNFAGAYDAMHPERSGYDDAGHGTHVAGVAAASLADAYGVGAANVRILSAKVLDANGTGHESDLAFGLAWCAQQGASVAVMALSVTDADHPTLQRAIRHAAERDVLLMASAGNTGGNVLFPASDPRVMAVSAVDGNLTLAPFSSRGKEVELAAPGVHVVGPLPGGEFAFGSGTSQAVAYAAGVATLLRDRDPGLTSSAARDVLAGSAKDLGPPGRDAETGRGLVDVGAALRGR